MRAGARRRVAVAALFGLACGWSGACRAQAEPSDGFNQAMLDERGPFSFAVIASDPATNPDRTVALLKATDAGPVRFVVHAQSSLPSPSSCGDPALQARRTILDTSAKPVVPIASATEWADCGDGAGDPFERLQRVDDTLFATDRSLGQAALSWSRQSAVPRFRRYRENLRWQWGGVMFATINLPNNNNDYRLAAGRNGEFEDRTVANRAWLERTFRLASERKLAGVVLFVDAAPRFSMPLRAPDARSRERDGYYEWKIALRESVVAFKGCVLLVQARYAAGAPRPIGLDHPLRDVAGRPIENLWRIAAPPADGDAMWLRIDVDPANPVPFRVSAQRVFDDPSGELYGSGPAK